MNHISFIDALVLTTQVFAKIALNFWPMVVLFVGVAVYETLSEKKKAKKR